jgi:hypothetical protein
VPPPRRCGHSPEPPPALADPFRSVCGFERPTAVHEGEFFYKKLLLLLIEPGMLR